jgi:hypothetical protein
VPGHADELRERCGIHLRHDVRAMKLDRPFGCREITGDPRIYGRVYVGSSNRGVLYADPAK